MTFLKQLCVQKIHDYFPLLRKLIRKGSFGARRNGLISSCVANVNLMLIEELAIGTRFSDRGINYSEVY